MRPDAACNFGGSSSGDGAFAVSFFMPPEEAMENVMRFSAKTLPQLSLITCRRSTWRITLVELVSPTST